MVHAGFAPFVPRQLESLEASYAMVAVSFAMSGALAD
jgi:hypothetical protein